MLRAAHPDAAPARMEELLPQVLDARRRAEGWLPRRTRGSGWMPVQPSVAASGCERGLAHQLS